jgi:hypothetical protein
VSRKPKGPAVKPAESRTWYLRRGGIPTRAAAWKSADPPDYVTEEGSDRWRPFDAKEERKIA